MKEHYNGGKKLIISHIADVDGLSSVILAKLHYENIDYCLVEFSELEELLNKLVKNDLYKKYDEIFITDISLRPSTIKIIDANEELKKRIRHFDHHLSEVDVMNKYPFVNIVNERNGRLECGTTLFYEHIEKDFKYKSEYLDKYLEAVRSYDTKGPFCGNKYGCTLVMLYGILGIDNFINRFCNGIKNGKDPITPEDRELINLELERRREYVDVCDKNLIRINLNGYNVGVSISESYRSIVGNELSKKYKDELDFILILNFQRNQFSFRTVRDDINVGEIAKSFTKEGGGHLKAAGMPLNSETLFILNLIKEAILKKEKKIELSK
ncbi:MAG: hypothetical protein IJK67_03435 [Bacilli bacterium]|nr:hypothetical protein [Bacilli bacterium]